MRKVSVSVSDDHMDDFLEVVKQARAAGLEVAEEMDVIGVVSGSIDDERMGELRSVPGVDSVEDEQLFEIAPPDSAVQSVGTASRDYGASEAGTHSASDQGTRELSEAESYGLGREEPSGASDHDWGSEASTRDGSSSSSGY